MKKSFRQIIILLPIINLAVGCGSLVSLDQQLSLTDLENADPSVRVRAIKWAGDSHNDQAVPLLVDRLMEEDSSVRFYSILALKRITGRDFGYDYKAPADERAQAVKRWREYLAQMKQKPNQKDHK